MFCLVCAYCVLVYGLYELVVLLGFGVLIAADVGSCLLFDLLVMLVVGICWVGCSV